MPVRTKATDAKCVRMTTTVAALVVLAYWIIYGCMVYQSPFTFAEMDFNHDGEVPYSEADYASSFETRMLVDHGRHCTEYFAYEAGCH